MGNTAPAAVTQDPQQSPSRNTAVACLIGERYVYGMMMMHRETIAWQDEEEVQSGTFFSCGDDGLVIGGGL